MWRDRDRERHTISGSGGNRLPNPGPDRSVRHFPDPRFLCPACSFITPFHGDFQCGHHRLQLADVPGVGERNQPVSLLTGGHSSCRPGGFFCPLLQSGQLHKRIRRRKRKIPPRQRQCFINARTGVPQYGQQHLAAQIRDVMEQGAHFRGQQVGCCAPVEVAILLRESAVAKSTPGAMGNRETRSGEFCRGMTLFMSYFSRSTRTVYGYRWFCCFWEKWGNNARWHRSGGVNVKLFRTVHRIVLIIE